jgi:hypothetical protein
MIAMAITFILSLLELVLLALTISDAEVEGEKVGNMEGTIEG